MKKKHIIILSLSVLLLAIIGGVFAYMKSPSFRVNEIPSKPNFTLYSTDKNDGIKMVYEPYKAGVPMVEHVVKYEKNNLQFYQKWYADAEIKCDISDDSCELHTTKKGIAYEIYREKKRIIAQIGETRLTIYYDKEITPETLLDSLVPVRRDDIKIGNSPKFV